jgi:hypothetical protein
MDRPAMVIGSWVKSDGEHEFRVLILLSISASEKTNPIKSKLFFYYCCFIKRHV